MFENAAALDPGISAFLERFKTGDAKPFHTLGVERARRAIEEQSIPPTPPEPVADVEDRLVSAKHGQVRVRIYRPKGCGPFPVLVYFHGGGWVLGSILTHDAVCRILTNRAGCVTVSVEYRLAPENRFPAGFEDCYGATCWVFENSAELGVDPSKLAVGGDSAGGNLAAAVALKARDTRHPQIALQLLIYPALDDSLNTPSHQAFGEGYFLTTADMEWFWSLYVRDQADRKNPLVCPAKAQSLAGLPPALIVTAEFDPLRDEAENYGERLREAGVPVLLRRYEGLIHGFFRLGHISSRAAEAVEQTCRDLRQALSGCE